MTRPAPPVVFDLDGTLIDSAPDIHRVANLVLGAEGLGPVDFAQVRAAIGNGVGVLVARLLAGLGEPPEGARQARLTAAFTAAYEHSHDLTRPYPGVRAALEALAAAGHPLAVCTNKPYRPACAALRHFGLDDCFAVVIGGDSLPRRKPDPAPLRAALAPFGVPGLFVGDSEVDAETAAAAGVPFLLFTGGYRKSAPEALPQAGRFDAFVDLPALVRAQVR